MAQIEAGFQAERVFDLMIIDDIYPSLFSPFRTLEYEHYLDFFDSCLLSMEGWHGWIENRTLDEMVAGLSISSERKARIFRFSEAYNISARLAYVTFLGNAFRLMDYFRARRLPFVLQLYPGGGFALNQPEVDAQLREVLCDPLCVKVIATQTITRAYVIDKIGCDPAKIVHVYGGVFNSKANADGLVRKLRYGFGKATVDLCFVAHKYGDDLASKGFDYFVAMARILRARHAQCVFHVVGDYTAQDIPLGDLQDCFVFYGRQPQEFFPEFYARMDGIISFNRPFVLMPGAFDGFPTGACLEAGFQGVANLINDPLSLNVAFTDGTDLMLLSGELNADADRISALIADPAALAELGEGTKRAFCRVMDLDRQLWPRTKAIAGELMAQQALHVNHVVPRDVVDRALRRSEAPIAAPILQSIAKGRRLRKYRNSVRKRLRMLRAFLAGGARDGR